MKAANLASWGSIKMHIIKAFQIVKASLMLSVWSPKRVAWIYKYSCVGKDKKFVYFRIPKSGNTTIVSSLLSDRPHLDLVGVRKNQFDSLSVLGLNDSSGYKWFSVVRNPYSRVLSAYLQKVEGGSKRKLVTLSDKDVTFDDFITFLEIGGLYKNGHWIPQSYLIPDGKFEVKIFKLESLVKDFKPFLKGISDELSLNVRNAHRTNSSDKLKEYYSQDLADRVYKLYFNDFLRFGYSRDMYE